MGGRICASTLRALAAAIFVAGLAASRPLSAAPDDPGLEPRSTYAVIVGVLEWKSKGLSSFSKENRREPGPLRSAEDHGRAPRADEAPSRRAGDGEGDGGSSQELIAPGICWKKRDS